MCVCVYCDIHTDVYRETEKDGDIKTSVLKCSHLKNLGKTDMESLCKSEIIYHFNIREKN